MACVWICMLQWGRNFIVAETFIEFGAIDLEPTSLQWGRNFIVAETWASTTSSCRLPPLQWGRNFIVAETSIDVP